MTAALQDALRLLDLPLDVPIDEELLTAAYRDAARANHPDAAPDAERDARTEAMRRINVARDVVRIHLDALAAGSYEALARDAAAGGSATPWWAEAANLAEQMGLVVNPDSPRVGWEQRFEAARRALAIAVGDTVSVERDGVLRVGDVAAFDSSVRVGIRTALGGIPIEIRRIGVEVEYPDGERETVDAAEVAACGWRCPVCLRTSAHGLARVRPCPRCIRRFRRDYPRWGDLAGERRRLRRRIERLRAQPTAFAPRRVKQFRELADALDDARMRAASLERTREALAGAVERAQADELAAEAAIGRTRTESGRARRERERKARRVEVAKAVAALTGIEVALEQQLERARALEVSVVKLERDLRRRHEAAAAMNAAGADRRARDAERAEKRLRELELELAAVAPDAPALLEGFDRWGQAPGRWLGEA